MVENLFAEIKTIRRREANLTAENGSSLVAELLGNICKAEEQAAKDKAEVCNIRPEKEKMN